jgi:hypothetical protein
VLSDVRRILALALCLPEEQGGLRSSRVRTSEWGRIIGSRWAGRAGAVALPRRRTVGESEFSAGLGSSWSSSARIQDLRACRWRKEETHMGCEQIGGGRSGPREADSRCGTRVSVGLIRDRDEGRVKGKAGVCGRRDAKMLGGKV